jgi:hypothetical protein
MKINAKNRTSKITPAIAPTITPVELLLPLDCDPLLVPVEPRVRLGMLANVENDGV